MGAVIAAPTAADRDVFGPRQDLKLLNAAGRVPVDEEGVAVSKKTIWFGSLIGSTIGGCVPMLWHASMFSISAIVMSTLGGVAGIWVVWRMGR